MHKRASDSDVAPTKRGTPRAFIEPGLAQMKDDSSLFFCVLYRDLLTHLTLFVLHGVPFISDPLALRFTSDAELCRSERGPLFPESTWISTLSHTGLSALLYVREPNIRCIRLFLNEECTRFSDWDIISRRPLFFKARTWAKALLFSESGGGRVSVYVITGYYDVLHGTRHIRIEHVDLHTGSDVSIIHHGPFPDTSASFSLSHDGKHLFACISHALLQYDASDLRLPPVCLNFDDTSLSLSAHACPYGFVLQGEFDGRNAIRIASVTGRIECLAVEDPDNIEETDLSCVYASHCIKDQAGRLYVPRITAPDITDICVYDQGRIVCRLKLPEALMFWDMKIAEPNTISLLCMYYDDDGQTSQHFVRCTIP